MAFISTDMAAAQRPVLLLGDQVMLDRSEVADLAKAVTRLRLPVYLSGMARGLLGQNHPFHLLHRRSAALNRADLVLLAGLPCDFRLDYGKQINPGAKLITVNRSKADRYRNRKPERAIVADPSTFLKDLAADYEPVTRQKWIEEPRQREARREEEIDAMAATNTDLVNPLALLRTLESTLPKDSIIVADGSDFVATAAYTLRPRGPLSWLDPGPLDALGVGCGYALASALCRPHSQVWLLCGDDSVASSIAELDSFVRHGLAVILLVGNDACCSQVGDRKWSGSAGPRYIDYHLVAQGWGGEGLVLKTSEQILSVLTKAAELAVGKPVLSNALADKTEFRKDAISL